MLDDNPNKVRLFALRSFGESLYDSITDASLEFGYKTLQKLKNFYVDNSYLHLEIVIKSIYQKIVVRIGIFKKIPVGYTVASKDAWGNAGNPNTVLGKNTELNESTFYEYVKKFMKNGATILGGCCEIGPSHIKEISRLK